MSEYFGRCSVCVRKAFFAALISSLFAGGALFFDFRLIAMGAASVALLTTGLWILHLLGYATRVANLDSRIQHVNKTRREVFEIFLRAIAAGLVLSLPKPAFALGPCGGSQNQPCGDCFRNETDGSCTECHSCGSGCEGQC